LHRRATEPAPADGAGPSEPAAADKRGPSEHAVADEPGPSEPGPSQVADSSKGNFMTYENDVSGGFAM
jgi:hypothetical protein